MACRPGTSAAFAALALLLAIALIIFAICVERPREPNNIMKFDRYDNELLDSHSDESQSRELEAETDRYDNPLLDSHSDESQSEQDAEAVLPVDSDVAGSVAGDLQDLLGKAMFLVGTTTTTTASTTTTAGTERISSSGSSLDMDMEHSASITEVRF